MYLRILSALLITVLSINAALAAEPASGAAGYERKLTLIKLNQSIKLARNYLLCNQKDAGNFVYEYDFIKKEFSIGDSEVRQAGALWGIALMHHDSPSPQTALALKKGLRFFIKNSKVVPKGKRFIVYPNANSGRTGTVALVALALVEYLRTDKTVDCFDEYNQYLKEFIEFLLSLRLQSGQFDMSYQIVDGKGFDGPSPYFDGETLLALIKAAKYLDYNKLQLLIMRSAEAMYQNNIVEALKKHPDSKITKGFYQWSSMAYYELYTSGWKGAEFYAQRVIDLAYWMIDVHHTLIRKKNTAYAYEGMISAWELAHLTQNKAALQKIGAVIDVGLYKLISWQVGGPHQYNNAFLITHKTSDPLAIGGVMNAEDDPVLRIDVTQHQLHALLLARRFIYAKHPATAVNPEMLTPEALLESIQIAGSYLTSIVNPKGKFIYIYQPDRDRIPKEYNLLRHAGTTFAMLDLYSQTKNPNLFEAAKRAIEYLVRTIKPCGTEGAACAVEGDIVKLGGNGLALVALSKYTEVTGDRQFLPMMQKLAKWIGSVQAQTGNFVVHKQRHSTGKSFRFVSVYYPSEALLGLNRLYALDKNENWLDIAEKGAKYLINVRDMGKRLKQIEHDHWLLYALNDLYRYRKNSIYIQHALKITRAILAKQNNHPDDPDWMGSYYQPPRSTSTACRSEGLSAAYLLVRDFGIPSEADEILDAIKHGVSYQLRTQFTPESVFHLPKPHKAIGGFRKSLTDQEIRIDYVQHNISSILNLYRIMKKKDSI